MSKKILAMLLVIVMVISMVPMVASAAEGCNHDTGEVKYTDNKNGTHQVTCKCGKVIAEAAECEFVDGRCVCGARKAGCKHDGEVSYKNNNDGTHKVTCECGKVIAEAAECEFVGGRCVCGARKAGCKHNGLTYWKNNNDGTHTITCECGVEVNAAAEHVYNEQNTCACGAIKPTKKCDANDHVGNKVFKVGVEATCTAEGVMEIWCDACNQCVRKEPIAKKPHNVIVVDEKAPTYLAAGYKTYACSVCGGEKVTEPLPMLVRPSTDGYDYVPRTGSAFVEWLYALIFG